MLRTLRLATAALAFYAAASVAAPIAAAASAPLPSPKEHFGFAIGDDYHLATYTQAEAYFKKLAAASDRLRLVDTGKTEEGRTQWMVICTSPANLAKLDRYKEISQRLARAEGLTEEQARALAAEGRAVVWIDGGLHATETVGAHQLIETLWNFASRTDAETLRILDQCIILFTHANPDGMELTSSWYMRRQEPTKRIVDALPRLYEKYIGHDNNRDFFMSNTAESTNINRQLYLEWLPQIVYNHHQTAPVGAVVAGPPYRDPFNYVFDPALVTSLDSVGSAMNSRLNLEGKPGYTQRSGSVFSTWWNGGLRTTTYFHNMLGLLTEIVGSPTPMEVALVPTRQLPSSATPFPVAPQKWHYAQSIAYSVSLNYAVLDYAARQRDYLLFNIWRMGRNSIDRGSRDTWTKSPRLVELMKAANLRDNPPPPRPAEGAEPSRFASQNNARIPSKYYDEVMTKPELRDPRGYILSADQADFPTAIKFLNALIKTGISIHRATADFTVAGKKYPKGSYVVKTAQAFRPHVIDMFEPQDHPNDFAYEGAPPTAPYDSAGWTLAFEMGVQFDRVLDAFDGPFAPVPYGELQSPPAAPVPAASAGWLLSRTSNNTFILVNRLLQAGAPVSVVPATGDFFVPASAKAALETASAGLGVIARSADTAPAAAKKVTAARIALWDRYGGSMPSGWTRWLLEQFGYAFDVVYPNDLDAGELRKKYDVIIFPSGAIPRPNAPITEANEFAVKEPTAEEMPVEYRNRLGKFTPDKTVPALKSFLEAGGTIVTVGTSANLAFHLRLPVRNALQEPDATGRERVLPSSKYYIPGSILRVTLDPTAPANWGMGPESDIYFDADPVFKLAPDAVAKGLRPLAWFPNATPLRSGWAWGQHYLRDTVAAFEAPVGSGKLLVYGPEITFRAQTHATFRLLFNALYQ
ncbi:MAG: M14 family metallopeptidase [Verrucomicrobia bacterium]|nr:M14 family metallopeptidase [Verrucomicrobiota bacterium]